MDSILDVLSWFDWISPLWAYVQDFLNGPGCSFVAYWPMQVSAKQLKAMLEAHGIKTWGWLVVSPIGDQNRYLMFTVKREQVRWAWYLLQKWQIPVAWLPEELKHGAGRLSA